MKYIALDIETIGLKPFGGTVWIITLFDGKKIQVISDPFGIKDVPDKVRKVLADPEVCKVIHNAEFDIPYLKLCLGLDVVNIWDTRIAEQVILGSSDKSSSLKETLIRYGFPVLNKDIVKQFIDRPLGTRFTKEEIEYASADVKYLLDLRVAQEKIATRDKCIELVLLENKVVQVLAGMKIRGIGFDLKFWNKLAKSNEAEYVRRMNVLPQGINWGSPKQVKQFFTSMGIPFESFSELPRLADKYADNKYLSAFIEGRQLYKATTSYGYNWSEFVDPDGRIRGSYNQILTTGRLSMNKPNLQQIPSGGLYRKAFIAKPGYKLVIGDFSNQEIGIMAAASNEKIWIDALLRKDDVHSLTASLLFGPLWDKAGDKSCTFPKKCYCPGHKPLRNQAKVLNFMLAYGGGAERFSDQTGITEAAAKQIIQKYKRIVPRLTTWLSNNGIRSARTKESFSADPYKRRRVLSEPEEWMNVNQGKNNPIQSAGANLTKLSMISLPAKYPIVLQLHDELVLEVPAKEAKKAVAVLRQVMQDSADYITGIHGIITVNPRIADNFLKQ